MLHREDAEGLIVVAQPAHAWIAAQMARAWGNERFGTFAPWEEVCLGAEQHDNGWTAWEREPRLNPATGRPYTFMNMPTGMHVRVWAGAGEMTLTQGRYAALLVSMHGSGLYERFHDYTRDTREEAQAARDFIAREHAFQERILTGLRADPLYAPYAAPEIVERNRRLVAVWDGLSLGICHGLHEPREYGNVPAADGSLTLTLAPIDGDPTHVTVDPWPFHPDSVTLTCEGRRLPQTFTDEAAMCTALAAAPWVTITTRLQPRQTD
jgi:Protein of unknown function (DUF3891)